MWNCAGQWYDIFINCNWVVNRWQYTFTHKQIHRTTQITKGTTQITTNVEQCGPCPVFASFTLAFTLQLRKKHGKPSVRVRKISVRLRKTLVRVQYIFIKTPTHYQTLTNTQNTHKHTKHPQTHKTLTNTLIKEYQFSEMPTVSILKVNDRLI